MQFAKPSGHLFEYDNKRAEPLARWIFNKTGHPLHSVADVGCGQRPLWEWVRKMNKDGELDYFGVDVDPAAVAKLNELGLQCLSPAEAAERTAEVVMAYEVIEHIPDSETIEFWTALRQLTGDILVLTTPNFEGFMNGVRPSPELSEMRYIPDHLTFWAPQSTDPHAHKMAYDAQTLSDRIAEYYPAPEWDWVVYRGWRWSLIDHATSTVFDHFFKLHAVVWRKSLYRR